MAHRGRNKPKVNEANDRKKKKEEGRYSFAMWARLNYVGARKKRIETNKFKNRREGNKKIRKRSGGGVLKQT